MASIPWRAVWSFGLLGVYLGLAGCGGPSPSAEDKFRAIADANEKALRQHLEGKESSLTAFKATIAEEKEDVQKRATFPFTGKIEFSYGAGKRVANADGKGWSQDGGRGVAEYRFSKAEQRWQLVSCGPAPNFSPPRPEDRAVEFEELARLFTEW